MLLDRLLEAIPVGVLLGDVLFPVVPVLEQGQFGPVRLVGVPEAADVDVHGLLEPAPLGEGVSIQLVPISLQMLHSHWETGSPAAQNHVNSTVCFLHYFHEM